MSCPECGSDHVGGLMQSFWVPLDDDGLMEGDWIDYQGETEIGGERICYDCDHEWEE